MKHYKNTLLLPYSGCMRRCYVGPSPANHGKAGPGPGSGKVGKRVLSVVAAFRPGTGYRHRLQCLQRDDQTQHHAHNHLDHYQDNSAGTGDYSVKPSTGASRRPQGQKAMLTLQN